jgi:GDP-mannose 6-dehydrogenase
MTTKYDVCMLGMGPVGCVSGLCFAKQGFQVIGVDINPQRVEVFASGNAPFEEEGVHDLVKETQKMGTFHVTSDAVSAISQARIIMIAVGTPTPEETGIPDLSQLDSVAKTIGEAIKNVAHKPIVVVRSTVPPKTMRNRIAKIIEEHSGKKQGVDFNIGSNPEFLREGKAIKDFFSTGRVVIGADTPEAADEIEKLYKDVQGKRVKVAVESAEFAKYVDNTWHAIKVTYANEIGRMVQAFGGNPEETTKIFLADDQLNISAYYLRPGFAFGGSCLPKDARGLLALAKQHGVNLPMVAGVLPSNEEQIDQGVARIMKHNPKKVAILGAAFKEHVDDLRESPALMVASKLIAQGVEVIGHDPHHTIGSELVLPRTDKKLKIVALDEAVAFADVLAQLHNIDQYNTLAKTTSKPTENLTTVTNVDPHDVTEQRKAG